DARDWLADQPGGGARPLIGALERLKVLSRGVPDPLDRDGVAALLAGTDAAPAPTGVDRIVARVAAAFGGRPKDLLGPSRLRAILVPRQVAMYLAREMAKLSLVQIGRQFGGRDHTTVLHAVRTVEGALAADPKLAGTVRELWAELT